jgi:hypothetical protein
MAQRHVSGHGLDPRRCPFFASYCVIVDDGRLLIHADILTSLVMTSGRRLAPFSTSLLESTPGVSGQTIFMAFGD